MIDPDRLDELECWRPEDDCPDDAKVRIPAGDLRDLVALIQVVRAAMAKAPPGPCWYCGHAHVSFGPCAICSCPQFYAPPLAKGAE